MKMRRRQSNEMVVFAVCGLAALVVGTYLFISQSRPTKTKNSWPYHFVKSKTERTGFALNVMDLYYYSGPLDVEVLKQFCLERKQHSPAKFLYYVVIFDELKNVQFPSGYMASQFELDDHAMQHIRAIYTYNITNGYSHLSYYGKNMWDGPSHQVRL